MAARADRIEEGARLRVGRVLLDRQARNRSIRGA